MAVQLLSSSPPLHASAIAPHRTRASSAHPPPPTNTIPPPPSSPSPSPLRHSSNVFVACLPIRTPPGPAQWLVSAAHSMDFHDVRHYMTILQPALGEPCVVFDFRPLNPEDPFIAFTALSGGKVPGIVLERELSRLPTKRCWWIGQTLLGMGIEDAKDFNSQWDAYVQLWKHDCRDHTEALVEFLTGKKQILLQLKELPSSQNFVEASQAW